jgi:hypothetical protein
VQPIVERGVVAAAAGPVPRRPRRLRASLTALIVAAAGAVVVAGMGATSGSAAVPECVNRARSERDALVAAKACGRPVPVDGSRSEYVQVVAQPDGRLTFESAVAPQRTRRSDGSWADVDLRLRAGTDGLLRPVASVADVAFSGGGPGPLVALKRGGKSMSLTWPGRLPEPVVSGDSATYPDVLPDVDLVVRATHTGFAHSLVVRSARAAANPAVRTISFKVGGDVRVEASPDGSLRAVAGSIPVAEAGRAVMWDSSLPSGARSAGAPGPAASASTAFAAGDGARTARVVTRVARGGDLQLLPDLKSLDAADTTFPVFVDPEWSVAKPKWAYATSNGCTNEDYAVARVGLSPEGPCVGARYRSFFEFPTTNGTVALAGKHIQSAYVHMNLDHSWSCGDTWTHMYLTPAINATMRASWSSMTLKKWLASAAGHANEAGGCSDSPQRDMEMNFINNAVTEQVKTAAAGSWPTITVGFCACNDKGEYESAQDRWKKFFPKDAKLVVDYDSTPGRPTGLQVARVACPADGVTVGTKTPEFSATYPDADTGQILTGTYEWIEMPSAGMGTVTDTYPTRLPPPSKGTATAGGLGTSSPVSVGTGTNYAFRVKTQDPAPYSLSSDWSDWCQFSVDTSVPPAPEIAPGAVPGPGQPITFTFSTPATDVAKFRYSWTGPPGTPHTVRAYAGDGAGGFGTAYTEPATGWDTDGTVISPGDLSGDGKPDVIFRRQGGSGLYLVRGDGAGGFVSGPEFLDGGNWSGAQFLFSPGDFTGDGKPDLMYRDAASQNLYLRRGTAGGGVEPVSVQIGTGWGSANWIFSPGDFNGDGKADVLYRKSDGTLYMVRGNGTGGWVTGSSEQIGTGFSGAELFGRGDFSGDGKTDVISRINSTGQVKLRRGNGAGGWLDDGVVKGILPSGGAVLALDDFTGDGGADILVTVAAAPNFGEVAATGTTTKTATVTVPVYKYGTNIMWARSIDSTGNLGNPASLAITVGRPSPPVARWGLETYPGQSQAQALADAQPALGDSDGTGPIVNNTPLTASNVTWLADARLIGGRTASMTGSGQAYAAGPVVDRTKSFSAAARVRITDTSGEYKSVVSQDGSVTSGFHLYYHVPTKQWGFSMYHTDSTSTAGSFILVPGTPDVWTHLAGVYDASAGEMRLYVNGALAGTAAHTATWKANGKLHIGWAKWGNGNTVNGAGQIADVQMFDRALVAHDFTGQLASDPESGGVNEPGMLSPVEVGRWAFESARSCYIQDLADTCETADGTPFGRWLALRRGVAVGAGNRGNGLYFDGYYFPDENPEPWETTQEWGRSAIKAGLTPPDQDGNQNTVWQDTPVLRTDQSFTVSAWVHLGSATGRHTILSQDDQQGYSGFDLSYRDTNNGEWVFTMRAGESDTVAGNVSTAAVPAGDPTLSWHHLVGVFDAERKQIRLYVDGVRATTTGMNTAWRPWNADGAMAAGRSDRPGGYGDWLTGAVDDFGVLQGAMSDAQVSALYGAQAVEDPQP